MLQTSGFVDDVDFKVRSHQIWHRGTVRRMRIVMRACTRVHDKILCTRLPKLFLYDSVQQVTKFVAKIKN